MAKRMRVSAPSVDGEEGSPGVAVPAPAVVSAGEPPIQPPSTAAGISVPATVPGTAAAESVSAMAVETYPASKDCISMRRVSALLVDGEEGSPDVAVPAPAVVSADEPPIQPPSTAAGISAAPATVPGTAAKSIWAKAVKTDRDGGAGGVQGCGLGVFQVE